MNIFLLPYTWARHLAMGLWCGGAGLLAWWSVLTLVVWFNADWPPNWDGPVLMCAIAGAVSVASILGESLLRRLPIWKVATMVGIASAVSVGFTLLWVSLWVHLLAPVVFGALAGGAHAEDAGDPTLVSLTYRLGAFAMGGLSSGTAALVVRRFVEPVSHLFGGVASGLLGGLVWYILCTSGAFYQDLYIAGAGLGLTWGLCFGLLTWSIPDDLYAGWVRVMTGGRYGRRIPIDALDGGPKERFVGHFPRGLDLFLPVEEGVLEMHLSVTVDAKRRFTARGLSLYPIQVLRFLERVDLRYDPRRPAPLETELSSGDRIRIGDGTVESELEFLLLPREEV
jgi:hypothetical protein